MEDGRFFFYYVK